MADITKKDPRGLTESSQNLLKTFIDTPEEQAAATKYMDEATRLIEDPFEPQRQQVREGYEGVTKSKEELKRRTELQELIDLAVKGVVKAYAGYEGGRTGLDLSKTTIETPDRSAAYARGLETIRGRQEEVQLKERDLFKDLQTRDKRFGEFRADAQDAARRKDNKELREDEHRRRLEEKKRQDADKESEAKKLKYNAVISVEKDSLSEMQKLAGSVATDAAAYVAAIGQEAELKGRGNLLYSLKKLGATDDETASVLKGKNIDVITDFIQKKAGNIAQIHKARMRILTELSTDGRAATPQEVTRLSLYELGTDTPGLIPAFSTQLPTGQVALDIFKEGSSTAPTFVNPDLEAYEHQRKELIARSRDASSTSAVKKKALEDAKKMDATLLIWKAHIAAGKSPEELKAALREEKLEVPTVQLPSKTITIEDRYTLDQELEEMNQKGQIPWITQIGVGK